jgi:hypothetical protein
MNQKIIITGMSLFAGVVVAGAASINIPDGNFQNITGVLNAPLTGILGGNIGDWSVQFNDVLNAGGQIAVSNAAAVGWVTPPSGSGNEMKISLPLSVAASATISENLTNQLQPDSVYTLSVDIDAGSTLDLLDNASLNLYSVAGSTNLASLQGETLVSVMVGGSSGYQTATLTYKTPNTVPSTAIGVSLDASGVGDSGTIYVDNFQLTQAPIQVQMGSSFTVGNNGSGPTVTLSGQGGAPGATYKIITSTNLLSSSPVWSVIVTNQFDANGDFSQTFAVDPSLPYRYFKTVVP